MVTTHGIALGGDHIDQRLFRTLLFPLLGKGERWKRRGMDREIETHFPFEDYEDLLLNWAVTYTLNQNKYTTPVFDCIEQGGSGAVKFKRLRELISQNLSYVVFQAIKDFKAELSSAPEAVLDIPELDVDIRMTRAEFEDADQRSAEPGGGGPGRHPGARRLEPGCHRHRALHRGLQPDSGRSQDP